jgi:hypothetical protein
MPRVVEADWKPGSPLSVYSMDDAGDDVLGTIAIVARDHINTATTTSLVGTDFSWIPAGKSMRRKIIQGGILTLQRNEAIQRMEGDWLLFIDDDMVWRPNAVAQLVAIREELDLDMVGGLCFRRTPPHQPTLYMREHPNEGPYNFLEKWDSDVVEVDATGLAFCLIHKRVFERIAGTPMPPLAERGASGPPQFFSWQGRLGEDLRFCQDAKTSGSKIYVDTRIEIGHIAEMEIGYREFLQQVVLREPDVEEARRAVNDTMGLATMTAAEAWEKLGWQSTEKTPA